jgi:aminoglycoside phosphotransferase (APT) family kinase protein
VPDMTHAGGYSALPGLDLVRLHDYMRNVRPDLVGGEPLTGRLITGGRSNLTFLVSAGANRWVLRRPPLGHVLATAHDMAREYRVIKALAGTAVPVPVPVIHCADVAVIGSPFYLVTEVSGVVYRDRAQTDALSASHRRRLAFDLTTTLSVLHSLDPAEVGLADFGRPEGFLQRQIRRWSAQLHQSRSRPQEKVDELLAGLLRTCPESGRAALVHGDFRLDNVMAANDARRSIAAVLDWEMATLGDPLTDLGLLLVYWDGLGAIDNPILSAAGTRAGFPPGSELAARYAEATGRDVSRLWWYVAFGCFKLAAILEGIYWRFLTGHTVGHGFGKVGTLVEPLADWGLSTLAARSITLPGS